MVIAEQNERLLSVLEQISEKLDALANIESAVESLSYEVGAIKEELQWHKNLTFASRLIESVDAVASAIDR
jgi:hypothetical protein